MKLYVDLDDVLAEIARRRDEHKDHDCDVLDALEKLYNYTTISPPKIISDGECG